MPLTPSDVRKLPALSLELEGSLFEHFMLFNTVSIKVHGENVPLAWMIGRFGQRWLEEMIEQRALRFVLWTPGIGHNVTEIPGLHGIMAANFSSPAHSDPEKSIDLGLNWLTKPVTAQTRRLLRRKLAPLYYVPPNDIAQDTVLITTSAFNSGKLKGMGFDPNEKSIGNLSLPERELLANCSNDLLEYRYLLSQKMTSFSEFKYFSFFSDSVARIKSTTQILTDFDELSQLNEFPDLQNAYFTIPDAMKRLPKIRASRDARNFRMWLAATTSGDAKICTEFMNSIQEPKSFFESRKGKFIKSVAMTAIGTGAGAMLEQGLAGMAAGAIISKIAEPVVDLGLDLIDEYLLSIYTKGWQPRMFFDRLKSLSENNE